MVDSAPKNGQDLESLVIHSIYAAKGFDEPVLDDEGNPAVTIFSEGREYKGRVIASTTTNLEMRTQANSVRDKLIKGNPEKVSVMVIASINDSDGNHYLVTGSGKTPRIRDEHKIDMKASTAFRVVKGKDIFYARCMFYSTKRGEPMLRIYEYDGTRSGIKGYGVLIPVKTFRSSRSIIEDENILASERRITSRVVSNIKPGDYVLVREVNRVPESGKKILEPVVNFMPYDDVNSPNLTNLGDRKSFERTKLVTTVEDYTPGSRIFNLPILYKEQSRFDGKTVGVGRVRRPYNETESFPFKPVFVVGAERFVGRYIRQLRIISNRNIIFAGIEK